MQRIFNPTPIFLNARGDLLDGGNIYLGVANADPEADPITAYWDSALTDVAEQPLRTIGGLIVNGATPSQVFVEEDDFSLRVRGNTGVLINYSPSAFANGVAYQPLDADLTAIASLSTTPFGRTLLTLANQAALATATGLAPFTGGKVSLQLFANGAGAYTYWVDDDYQSGRIFISAEGSADPTTALGDIWMTF